MSENSNKETEMLNEKLKNLWQQYSDLFNDYNPLIEETQRDRMDYLMHEIRTLESKIESVDIPTPV